MPFEGNYYTVPAGTQETRILQVFQQEEFERSHICFGDINVNEVISMYKKLQFHNHQNLGYVSLTVPLQEDYGHGEHLDQDPGKCGADLPEPPGAQPGRESWPLNNHFEGTGLRH